MIQFCRRAHSIRRDEHGGVEGSIGKRGSPVPLIRGRLDSRFVIKDSPCYVGLNKSEPALMAEVNRILDKSKKNGALNDISKKWLLAPLPSAF